MIIFHIITLFPEAVQPYLDASIIGRAQKENKIAVKYYNPRDFTVNKFRNVDGRPYGGGPGMVLAIEPIVRTVTVVKSKIKNKKSKIKIILFSPGGKQFDNKIAKNYVQKYSDLILICGRYEGIDARVKKILSAQGRSALGGKVDEISIGPFVLSGGEVPAMVMVDAMARQIPGVLGNEASPEENRVSSHEMYTRPEIYEYAGKKYKVPKVLIGGHHAKIEEWKIKRKTKSLKRKTEV